MVSIILVFCLVCSQSQRQTDTSVVKAEKEVSAEPDAEDREVRHTLEEGTIVRLSAYDCVDDVANRLIAAFDTTLKESMRRRAYQEGHVICKGWEVRWKRCLIPYHLEYEFTFHDLKKTRVWLVYAGELRTENAVSAFVTSLLALNVHM